MTQPSEGFPCFKCDKNIPDGTSMWSITINHETLEKNGMNVHSSDCYHVFCEECAKTKDFSKIIVPDKDRKK
jgi:hypothetical protein